MSNTLKILLTTIALSAVWFVLGIAFVPIESVDHLRNYFYCTVPYGLFFFLPISLLFFSQSKPVRVTSWIFVALSIANIAVACLLYFWISDFQRNSASVFDIIFSIYWFEVMMIGVLIGGPF